ncbi:hypothetical protein D7319_31350 [Streptomyces radicis]|uniref:Uncharacterized protein n=1 Tax=Streptomyces radicis TaxID=1750517 RepID=A0A3A9VR62_9ACTN|nr:hypothetical protein D7319_31350 [Streptomyces radicis]RKN20323.1 hypothetical protein D7318_19470 [Streptomyces radicis]
MHQFEKATSVRIFRSRLLVLTSAVVLSLVSAVAAMLISQGISSQEDSGQTPRTTYATATSAGIYIPMLEILGIHIPMWEAGNGTGTPESGPIRA